MRKKCFLPPFGSFKYYCILIWFITWNLWCNPSLERAPNYEVIELYYESKAIDQIIRIMNKYLKNVVSTTTLLIPLFHETLWAKLLRDFHNLYRLQHIRYRNHQVSRLNHTPCLQQNKCTAQVTFHVFAKIESKRNKTPLQVQAPSHMCGRCERKYWAIGPTTRQKGRHVTLPCVHKYRIHSQIVCYNQKSQTPYG